MRGSLRKENRHILSHCILLLWTCIVLFPLWTLMINSFKTRLTIYENPFWIPKTWNFSNYTTVLRDGDFFTYFKNSFLVVSVSLVLVTLLASLAGYALARYKSRIAKGIYYFFITGMMIPIKIASIKLLEIVRVLGLLNTIYALPPHLCSHGIAGWGIHSYHLHQGTTGRPLRSSNH